MANLKTPIPKLKLNDGTSIPMLGYGTGTAWYKSGDEHKIDQTLIDTLKMAIGMDYIHLDCAEMYKTESELGRAIKESGVDRSKLYITTKVAERVNDIPSALKTSLEKLQLDHVDLYLIHTPFFAESDSELQHAWAAMEKVQAAGLTKSIGVSNFSAQHLEAVLKTAKVVPAVNQIEFHAYLQHTSLLEMHKKYGIATEAYGPLSAVTKASPGPIDGYVAGLAKKYAVSQAEIALRWCIDQDIIPITTSAKEQRLSDYLRCATFKLTPKEIGELAQLGDKKHYRGFFQNKFAANDRN